MKNNKKGFTLIEILIAMSIISLIAMAFFTIVNTSIKINTKNETDLKSLNIATSEIENLREQIKDINDSNIIINNELVVEAWSSSGNVTKVKDKVGNSQIITDKKVRYTKSIDGFVCNVEVEISKGEISTKGMYLYNIKIDSMLQDKYFTKKNTTLETSVFGK